MAENGTSAKNVGKVIEIKGVVIDAVFGDRLPSIYTALRIEIAAREQDEARVLIAEVQQHLGDDRVRAVAMDTTDGLARGTEVVDTGQPISVPVGNETLGRIWNVLGEPVDNKPPAPEEPSAGRSTAIRRSSRTSRRRRRSSRPASRSST